MQVDAANPVHVQYEGIVIAFDKHRNLVMHALC
jgi:hypothetical protein